ncbi:MAG TPA: poly-beta-1,6-N-acetyl-D-glucosamine N-deacetylase PgaB [Methylophilaceae bacterium]|nr:poly-beta-1,6-N-acetyl-D-glucosamine N-deacetylase PgaB [Methylophilaceae bacterium]HQR60017.1 poly-beta-1,6-N-acetyl-D-glucosamine N-deacetylase PgaB [Methylophilaceae bacterium]
MAILNGIRILQFAVLMMACSCFASTAAPGDFVVLCYHEVESDRTPTLTGTAVHASDLAAQFAWLKENGYHPVSLQQILDSRQNGPALPDKAVLLTFDDGKKDVYTRVFPLLKLFHYPAVVAVVGRWLDVPEGGLADYDGKLLPRSEFVTWDEIREMQRSGLVEIASHSYDLHRGVIANPQGNTQPATTTRLYSEGNYETDTVYVDRLESDMRRNRDLIERETGHAPRAMVWPYGRTNLVAQQLSTKLGMPVTMTLDDGVNTVSTPLSAMKRYLIEQSPSLQSFAEAMRKVWSADPARSVRIHPGEWPVLEKDLSLTLDRLQRLSVNIVFVDPETKSGPQPSPLFPSERHPSAADELNHIAWQIERRAGSPVFIDIPAAWLKDLDLLSELARQVNFAGVRMPVLPGDEAARRALAAMERWCWPLRVAYAPEGTVPASAWQMLLPGDLVVMPATKENLVAVPVTEAGNVLFEFDPTSQPASEIAREMRRLEADGFRQFGLADFPQAGYDAVWKAISLRSQPLLP